MVEKVKDPLLIGEAENIPMRSTWSPGATRSPRALGCHEFIPHRIPSAKTRVPLHDHILVMNSKQDVNLKIAEVFMDSPLIQSPQAGPLFSEMSSIEFQEYERTKKEKKKKRHESKKRKSQLERPRTMEVGRLPTSSMSQIREEPERPRRPRTMESRSRPQQTSESPSGTARSRKMTGRGGNSRSRSRSPSPQQRSLLSLSTPQFTRTIQGSQTSSRKTTSRPATSPPLRSTSNPADLADLFSSLRGDKLKSPTVSLMSASLPLNKELMNSKPSRLDKINHTAKKTSFYKPRTPFSPVKTQASLPLDQALAVPVTRKTSRRQTKLKENPSLYGPFAGRKDTCPTVRRLRELLARERAVAEEDGFSDRKMDNSGMNSSMTDRPLWNQSTFLFEGPFTGGGPTFGTGKRQSISKRSTLMQHGRSDPAFNISRKFQKPPSTLNLPRNTVEEESVFQKVLRMADLMNDVNLALKAINPADVVELGTMRRPGKTVELVVEALCVIFGLKNPSWKTAQKLLLRNSYTLLGLMGSLDVGAFPAERRQKLERYVHHPLLRQEIVEKSSKACTLICAWVQAVYNLSALRAGQQEGPESGIISTAAPATHRSFRSTGGVSSANRSQGTVSAPSPMASSSRRNSFDSVKSGKSQLSLTQRVGMNVAQEDFQLGDDLIRACQLNQVENVEELLNPQPNQSPVLKLSTNNSTNDKKGGLKLSKYEDDLGRTALHWAKNARIVELLLEDGADIGHRDKVGGTPLMMACRQGHVEVVQALVNAGAEVAAVDSQGKKAGESFISELHLKERSEILSILASAIKVPHVHVVQQPEDEGSMPSKRGALPHNVSEDIFVVEQAEVGDESMVPAMSDNSTAEETQPQSNDSGVVSNQEKNNSKTSAPRESQAEAEAEEHLLLSRNNLAAHNKEEKAKTRVSFLEDNEVYVPMKEEDQYEEEEQDFNNTTESHVRFVDNGVEKYEAVDIGPIQQEPQEPRDGFHPKGESDESEWSGDEDYDESHLHSSEGTHGESNKQEEQQNTEAIRIQRLARGHLARNKVKKLKQEQGLLYTFEKDDELQPDGKDEQQEGEQDNESEKPSKTENEEDKASSNPQEKADTPVPPVSASPLTGRKLLPPRNPTSSRRRSAESSSRRSSQPGPGSGVSSSRRRESVGSLGTFRESEQKAKKQEQKFALVASHIIPDLNGRFSLVFMQNEHSVILLIQDDAQQTYTHFIGASKDEIRSWLQLPTDAPVNADVWSQICELIMSHLQCMDIGGDEGFYFGLELEVENTVHEMKMQPLEAPLGRFPKLPRHTEDKPVFIAQVEGNHQIVGILSVCLMEPSTFLAYLMRTSDGNFVAITIELTELGYSEDVTLSALDEKKIRKVCWLILKGIRVTNDLQISVFLEEDDLTSQPSTPGGDDRNSQASKTSVSSKKTFIEIEPHSPGVEQTGQMQILVSKLISPSSKDSDAQRQIVDLKAQDTADDSSSSEGGEDRKQGGKTIEDNQSTSGLNPSETMPNGAHEETNESGLDDDYESEEEEEHEEDKKDGDDDYGSGHTAQVSKNKEKDYYSTAGDVDTYSEEEGTRDASDAGKESVISKSNQDGDEIAVGKSNGPSDSSYTEEATNYSAPEDATGNQAEEQDNLSGKIEDHSTEGYSSEEKESESYTQGEYQDNSSSFGPVELENPEAGSTPTDSLGYSKMASNEEQADLSSNYSDDEEYD